MVGLEEVGADHALVPAVAQVERPGFSDATQDLDHERADGSRDPRP